MAETTLSAPERTDLERLESVINQGLRTFVEVGSALAEVRDRRLYRESHGTFEAYCLARWEMTDRRARQLMAAASTVETVGTGTTVPANEAQARPLSRLPAEKQPEAWKDAVESSGGKPTAKHVEAAVKKHETPEDMAAAIARAAKEREAAERERRAPDLEAIPHAPLREVVGDVLSEDGVSEPTAQKVLRTATEMDAEAAATVSEKWRSGDPHAASVVKARLTGNTDPGDARFPLIGDAIRALRKAESLDPDRWARRIGEEARRLDALRREINESKRAAHV